jgi:hypothetical protein
MSRGAGLRPPRRSTTRATTDVPKSWYDAESRYDPRTGTAAHHPPRGLDLGDARVSTTNRASNATRRSHHRRDPQRPDFHRQEDRCHRSSRWSGRAAPPRPGRRHDHRPHPRLTRPEPARDAQPRTRTGRARYRRPLARRPAAHAVRRNGTHLHRRTRRPRPRRRRSRRPPDDLATAQPVARSWVAFNPGPIFPSPGDAQRGVGVNGPLLGVPSLPLLFWTSTHVPARPVIRPMRPLGGLPPHRRGPS